MSSTYNQSSFTETLMGINGSSEADRYDDNGTTFELINSSAEIPLSYIVVMTAIGVLIVISNFIVVIASGLIVKKGLEPRCTYLLLGNLSVADMMTGIFTILMLNYLRNIKYDNLVACSFQLALPLSYTIVSSLTVTMIAIDRFLYIIHGIKYNQLVYPKRVRCMISATWIVGLFIGLLPAFGWSKDWEPGTMCRFDVLLPKSLYVFLIVITILPIPIILFIYSIILVKAIKTIKKIATENSAAATWQNENPVNSSKFSLRFSRGSAKIPTISEKFSISSSSGYSSSNSTEFLSETSVQIIEKTEQYNANQKKWRALKIVFFTTGGYVFSWTPLCIDSLLIVLCDDVNTPERCSRIKNLSKYFSILAFTNCFLNPIIYAWWHAGFRKATKKIYKTNRDRFIEWYQGLVST